MSGPRPICVKCRLEMRSVKNDRPVADPEVGPFPSTYWLGDEYACPKCGAGIVTDFGSAMNLKPSAQFGPLLCFHYLREMTLAEARAELLALSGGGDVLVARLPGSDGRWWAFAHFPGFGRGLTVGPCDTEEEALIALVRAERRFQGIPDDQIADRLGEGSDDA